MDDLSPSEAISDAYSSASKTLDLSFEELTELPSDIGDLTGLSRLDLRGNHLSSLPDEFGNLTALSELNLGGNRFTELPSAIGNLTG